jgi:hypothetical protein
MLCFLVSAVEFNASSSDNRPSTSKTLPSTVSPLSSAPLTSRSRKIRYSDQQLQDSKNRACLLEDLDVLNDLDVLDVVDELKEYTDHLKNLLICIGCTCILNNMR